MGTIVGSMMEGPVGVGAAASLVAAHGTTAVCDLDAAWWLASSPVEGGLTLRRRRWSCCRTRPASGCPAWCRPAGNVAPTVVAPRCLAYVVWPQRVEGVVAVLPGGVAVVRVAVATLWSSPGAVRPADEAALGPHPDIAAWVAGMSPEQRLDGGVLTQLLLGEQVLVDEVRPDGWARVVALDQPAAGRDPAATRAGCRSTRSAPAPPPRPTAAPRGSSSTRRSPTSWPGPPARSRCPAW